MTSTKPCTSGNSPSRPTCVCHIRGRRGCRASLRSGWAPKHGSGLKAMPLHDAVTPGEAPAGLSPRGVESKEAGGGCPGHPSSPLLPLRPRPGPSPGPNAAAAPYCPGVGGGGRLLIRAFRSLHCSALGLPPTPQDTAVHSLGCAVSPYTPLSPCRGPLKCHLLPKPFSIALPRPCFDHGTNPNTHTCTHTRTRTHTTHTRARSLTRSSSGGASGARG